MSIINRYDSIQPLPNSPSHLAYDFLNSPENLMQDRVCDQNSIIDYSLRENRLRENDNGTVELQQKNIAEVVGEYLLRPTFDCIVHCICKTFSWVREGAISLDKITSQALMILPGANAEETGVVGYANPLNPRLSLDLTNYHQTFCPNDAAKLDDIAFFARHQKALAIKNEIDTFVSDITKAVIKFQENLDIYSQSYDLVHDQLLVIQTDLLKGEDLSDYSPLNAVKIHINLPVCTILRTPLNQLVGVTVSEGKLAINGTNSLFLEQSSLITPGSSQRINSLEKVIKDKFYEGSGIALRLICLDYQERPHTVDEFMNLFSDKAIGIAEEFVKQRRVQISNWVKNAPAFADEVFNKNHHEIHKFIKLRIQEIYQEHVKIIKKVNVKNKELSKKVNFEITDVKRDLDGQPIEWTVIKVERGWFESKEQCARIKIE